MVEICMVKLMRSMEVVCHRDYDSPHQHLVNQPRSVVAGPSEGDMHTQELLLWKLASLWRTSICAIHAGALGESSLTTLTSV